MHHRTGEVNSLPVAPRREPADHGTPRVAEAQRLGNLVKGLAHRVVDGGAKDLVVAPGAHMHKHRVATRDQARHEGRPEVGCLEEIGEQVAFKVVDRCKRQACGRTESLGKGDAHDKRTNETRTCGDAHAREVRGRQRVAAKVSSCLGHNLLEDADDGLDVLAGRNLGYDATKARMEVNRGSDYVRTDGTPRVDDGHRGLVAG